MKTVSAYKARVNFGEIINEIYYGGEEIVVERMGRPMVKIVPLKRKEDTTNPFLVAAGAWKKVKAEKLIKEIYRARKDNSAKREFLVTP